MSVNKIISNFKGLNITKITNLEYNNSKLILQQITQKLIEIIDAIAGQQTVEFTSDQKRRLMAALLESISTNYIVLPKEAKKKKEGSTGKSTEKLIEKIKSKIKEYINICTKLKENGHKLGGINNDDGFLSGINAKISTDELKGKLKKFLGVTKEHKMEKLIELITSKSNNNNSRGKNLIFSIVTSMTGIKRTNNSSNTLYYDIISNLFISDICDLIDLCTITKNSKTNKIVSVEYKADESTNEGDSASILSKDNQETLNEIIQTVVDYRTHVTESLS